MIHDWEELGEEEIRGLNGTFSLKRFVCRRCKRDLLGTRNPHDLPDVPIDEDECPHKPRILK